MLFDKILNTIKLFENKKLSDERKEVLQQLIEYIQKQKNEQNSIRINFICTHNSRRSHLCQIWAQTMAYFFNIANVTCYSGGTEATALFFKVAQTLNKQGFDIQQLSQSNNPVYAVKYASSEHPVICFSKKYDDAFNAKTNYAAILTCNSANEACPVVIGATTRIPIMYNDPKEYDDTPQMDEKYTERSIEIAQEMYYVFSSVV